jgi:1-acyl-sn-glycerol-3-phosphate acyltransferase
MSGLPDLWKKLKHWLWGIAHEVLFVAGYFVGPVVISLVADFKIEGPGRIPRQGGVMFTSNHMSQWDLVVVHNILPRSFNTMAKVEFFEFFFVGGLVRLLGAFPVNRGKADREALNHSIKVIKEGKLLGIFPEGHRSDNYALIRAHNGAALIARQSDATLVPVAITGTELISRKTDWKKNVPFWKRRPRVTVKIGLPYKLPAPVPGQKDDLDELTDLIMGKIAELLPPQYQGEYSPEKLAERKAERERAKQELAAKKAARKAARQQASSPTEEVTPS